MIGAHLVGQVQARLGAAHCRDDRQISVLAGDVERRVAMAILLVQVAAPPEEAADDFDLTAANRQVERSVAVLPTEPGQQRAKTGPEI